MLGSDVLVETLANAGIEVCFLNPGTTEVQSIVAIEGGNRIRPVMTLFEAVATGAADGYARMAGKPAMTLLHQGVGLANGLANLHNAQKAHMPVVNVVGQHSRNHQQYNVPLMSDVAAFAAPVSGWVREVAAPEDVGRDVSDAFAAAVGPPAQVATLIVPGDCTWSEAGQPQPAPSLLSSQPISADTVDAAAQALRAGEPSALVLGGPVVMAEDLEAAARIQAAAGARIIGSRFFARMQRGAGRFEPELLPYLHKDAAADVANLRHAILIGAEQPATFFDLPDGGGAVLPKTCAVHNMVKPGGDFGGGLRALADALCASDASPVVDPALPDRPRGDLTADKAAAIIARDLPEGLIVSEEANTAGVPCFELTQSAVPHDLLGLTGGGLGQGGTAATGAAVACPDRKVLCLQGDGAHMYTCQTLWTQARARLDVTTVVFVNRAYAVLKMELERLGLNQGSPELERLVDLTDPNLDYVKLAESMGVEAMRAETAEQFSDQFNTCMKSAGPHLIEAII